MNCGQTTPPTPLQSTSTSGWGGAGAAGRNLRLPTGAAAYRIPWNEAMAGSAGGSREAGLPSTARAAGVATAIESHEGNNLTLMLTDDIPGPSVAGTALCTDSGWGRDRPHQQAGQQQKGGHQHRATTVLLYWVHLYSVRVIEDKLLTD